MKIVTFLVSSTPNVGAEAVCVNIANGLAERGWQVDLLVLHTKNKSYIERLSLNVLIESIVLGTPVVSFDCPSGPRKILDYGKYGKLVQPDDVPALALAIEDVLAKPNQFNLAERAGFFGFEKAIDKYEKVLGEYS